MVEATDHEDWGFGKQFDLIGNLLLSSRGWTIQERVLSPRIVHHGEKQMCYDCESGILSEDGFIFPETSYSFDHLVKTQLIGFADHGL